MGWSRIWLGCLMLTALALSGCGDGSNDGQPDCCAVDGEDAGLDGGGDDGLAGDLDDGGGDPGPDAGGDPRQDGGDPGVDGGGDPDGGIDDGDAGADEEDGADGGGNGSDGDSEGDGGDGGGDVDPGAALFIEQIRLDGFMGESALVIGPDGTSVLIDTGNDSHDGQVLAAIERQLGQRRVDWIVLTHYHADHIGGIEDLLGANPPLQVTRGIVTRGLVDVGDTVGEGDFQEACRVLVDPPGDIGHVALCDGPALAPCDGSEVGLPWPAAACDGLLLGDLTDPADDADGRLSFLPLGDVARMVFFHADGHLATAAGVVSAEDAGVSIGHGATAPENDRSLGAVITWGAFQHSFHGDLQTDVDSFFADHGGEVVEAPGGTALVGPRGVDTTHLSHHCLNSATSQAWADWLLPADGGARNAVVGTNTGYIFSPSSQVMARVADGLGDGFIWSTLVGMWPGSNAKLRVAEGSVVIEVTQAGARYQVYALTDAGAEQVESYTALIP